MAIAPIKVISIIGLVNDLDKVVKICGESQAFHPDEVASFYSNTKGFVPFSEKSPYSKYLQDIKYSAEIAGIKLNLVDTTNFKAKDDDIFKYVDYFSNRIDTLVTKKASLEQEKDECNRLISESLHFIGKNLDIGRITKCKFVKSRFGRLPIESYERLDKYKDNPYILFFPCSKDNTHYWGVYFAPIDNKEKIDRIFSGLYFERVSMSNYDGSPEEYVEKLKLRLQEIDNDLEKTNNKIKSFWEKETKKCLLFYTKLEELNTYHSILNYVMVHNKSFVLVGWVSNDKMQDLTDKLDMVESVEYSTDDGSNQLKKSPPVKLKNNIFTKPYEFYVNMYGTPCYNEMDPTSFVAITYTILFGIMFGDLGQGIVVSIVGWLMWKLKKMPIGKILVRCGISGSIFGLIYGSVFGYEHLLDPLYKAIGFEEKPIEVMGHSAKMIIFTAIGIGIFLLILAMFLNIYSSFKRRDLESAIFSSSGIAGVVFYIAVVAGLVCTLVLHIKIMNIAYVLGLIILPLVLIFLREPLGKLVEGHKDWKPEKWSEYCMQNAFEMLETLLSYITNTMSFLRVGAFVFVHAGMMMVVFVLAELLGGVGYILVIIFGNALIMVLEALLVSIQVLRLEYYELFNRFYIGSGRAYNPVKIERNIN